MKVLVVGGGGREHAILCKLRKNQDITDLYCAPGNGGIAEIATCVPIGTTQIDALVAFAVENKMEYVVVAPDDPLCLGLVDKLAEQGIPAFGPTKAAARIEGSKVFAKTLMHRYHIPTAAYRAFDVLEEAFQYAREAAYPLVVKADGLALGKGVVICQTKEEAIQALYAMMKDGKFGLSGSRVVMEDFLTGPEVSVLCFTDGVTIRPMVSSMDHKRALDGDRGLNTGGMGAIAPNPHYTPGIGKTCMETIFLPTLEALRQEGCPFQGCLYFGLILCKDGPKVIEYNCRFGDPEAQAVLPLLESDLFTIMQATTDGRLNQVECRFSNQASCCVVLASGGYPEAYATGKKISGLEGAMQRARVFQAGTRRERDGILYTAGGRVLGVTAVADTLSQAVQQAYAATEVLSFEGMHLRRDIGAAALRSREQ